MLNVALAPILLKLLGSRKMMILAALGSSISWALTYGARDLLTTQEIFENYQVNSTVIDSHDLTSGCSLNVKDVAHDVKDTFSTSETAEGHFLGHFWTFLCSKI